MKAEFNTHTNEGGHYAVTTTKLMGGCGSNFGWDALG